MIAALLTALVITVLPAPAPAATEEAVIVSVPVELYTPVTVLRSGSAARYVQLDALTRHDVVSIDAAADGTPVFSTERILSFGESLPVRGVEGLAPGEYQFTCSLHPWMFGMLRVVSAGVSYPSIPYPSIPYRRPSLVGAHGPAAR